MYSPSQACGLLSGLAKARLAHEMTSFVQNVQLKESDRERRRRIWSAERAVRQKETPSRTSEGELFVRRPRERRSGIGRGGRAEAADSPTRGSVQRVLREAAEIGSPKYCVQ